MNVQAFDFHVDLLQALLWQYDNAARLRALLDQKQAWYDAHQQAFWTAWLRDVFDLRTANDFGLAVWGQILNVPLTTSAPPSGTSDKWAFGPDRETFSRGTFGRTTAGTLYLTTEQRRLILRLRYFQLVSRGAVPEINSFLREIFGPGAYVLDGLDMTLTYVFTFVPPSSVMQVLQRFDLLPRPAGVKVKLLIEPEPSFGFGAHNLNFENGNFRGE